MRNVIAWISFNRTTDSNKIEVMHLSMSSPRGGSGNQREFDCDAYPQGGDFDLTSCI